MLGVSRSEARSHFGINSRNSFSLKNRLWARLMEQLSAMEVTKDSDHKDLYRFSDGNKTILIRAYHQEWEEGDFRVVQLLDSENQVLIGEQIFPDGFSCNYSFHPTPSNF